MRAVELFNELFKSITHTVNNPTNSTYMVHSSGVGNDLYHACILQCGTVCFGGLRIFFLKNRYH